MFVELQEMVRPDQAVWDNLWNSESIGRIAVAVKPSSARLQSVRDSYSFDLDDTGYRPENWTQQWRESLLDELYIMLASAQLPGGLVSRMFLYTPVE